MICRWSQSTVSLISVGTIQTKLLPWESLSFLNKLKPGSETCSSERTHPPMFNLTIIPRVRFGYEMDEAHSAELSIIMISDKREWNNCFIKNVHKISMNLPDFILLQQTRKDKGLPLFTRLSNLSTHERTE